MKYLSIALWMSPILMFGTCAPAHAEEHVGRLSIQGGYICDTQEQLHELIEHQGQVPVEGCGVLRQHMWGDVYLLDVYEADGLRYLMARYDFPMRHPDGTITTWTQWGFWGRPQPIDPEPAGFDL